MLVLRPLFMTFLETLVSSVICCKMSKNAQPECRTLLVLDVFPNVTDGVLYQPIETKTSNYLRFQTL